MKPSQNRHLTNSKNTHLVAPLPLAKLPIVLDTTDNKGEVTCSLWTTSSCFDWLLNEAIQDSSAMLQANKASVSNPDTLSFEEAMSYVDNIQNWMRAAEAEIKLLEKNRTWKEVPTADVMLRILPGTWVFRRKRRRDSEVT